MAAHGLLDRLLQAVYEAVGSPQTTRKEEANVDESQTVPGSQEGGEVQPQPAPAPAADRVLTDEELRAQYEARFGTGDVATGTAGVNETPDLGYTTRDEAAADAPAQVDAGGVAYDGDDAVFVLAVNDDGSYDIARFANIERGVTMSLEQEYKPATD